MFVRGMNIWIAVEFFLNRDGEVIGYYDVVWAAYENGFIFDDFIVVTYDDAIV